MAHEWSVKASERIAYLIELIGTELGPDTVFEYSWNHGYEKYKLQNDGGGSIEYSGTFHPNIVCERKPFDTQIPSEPFVCCHCGAVSW